MKRTTTLDLSRYQITLTKLDDGRYELRAWDTKMNEDVFVPLDSESLAELKTMLNTFW